MAIMCCRSSIFVAILLLAFSAQAFSSPLGTELTPLGADPKPNPDKTIPSWSGKFKGLPPGLSYQPGEPYPDPYSKDKILFRIDAKNKKQYSDKLTDGTLALLDKFPESFHLHIYPPHRDFRYHEQVEKRTAWNLGKTQLVNGVDGLQQFTGGVPFPVPRNGAEVMWNARINQPVPVSEGTYDSVAVFHDGKTKSERAYTVYESPYAYEYHEVGTVAEDIGDIAAYVYIKMLEPKWKRGEKYILHEPLDQVKYKRKGWMYIPGAGRVKKLPGVGYDAPVGPGMFMTADDGLGFNGAMDRYDWKLIGKTEKYIPYHAYRFDEPGLAYDQLLKTGHVNPDYMRFELHRVWVVEATLKEGQRHVYARRLFYIDEDSWLIVATDAFDGRGELWRVGFQNTLYEYTLQGYITRALIKYDLQANAYVVGGLINQTEPTNFLGPMKGEGFYQPERLMNGRR